MNLSLSTDKREMLERYIRIETNLGDVVQQVSHLCECITSPLLQRLPYT